MPRALRILPWFAASLVADAEGVDFNRDIRPILTHHCTACHGGMKEAGGVSFVLREKALGLGESGHHTIVPGDPDASELIATNFHRQSTPICPPPGPTQWLFQGLPAANSLESSSPPTRLPRTTPEIQPESVSY